MLDIPTASKAAVVQTAVATALTYAGYRVMPYGIEERCPDLVYLDAEDYRALELPNALRSAPDLLVYSPSERKLTLLEVKYSRSWTAEVLRMMLSKLQRQQAAFPATHTVILRSASAAPPPVTIDDLVRVLPPDQLLLLATAQVLGDTSLRSTPHGPALVDPSLEPIWQRLQPLPESFRLLADQSGWTEILLRLLPALGSGSA